MMPDVSIVIQVPADHAAAARPGASEGAEQGSGEHRGGELEEPRVSQDSSLSLCILP